MHDALHPLQAGHTEAGRILSEIRPPCNIPMSAIILVRASEERGGPCALCNTPYLHSCMCRQPDIGEAHALVRSEAMLAGRLRALAHSLSDAGLSGTPRRPPDLRAIK